MRGTRGASAAGAAGDGGVAVVGDLDAVEDDPDHLAVDPLLVVEVRPGGAAGAADLADAGPGLHLVADRDRLGLQVGVEGGDALAVVDHDVLAVAGVAPVGHGGDGARGAGQHVLALGAGALEVDGELGVVVLAGVGVPHLAAVEGGPQVHGGGLLLVGA